MNFKDLQWKKFNVLDDGFITLVDMMGDDSSVVQAARVSYGEGTKKVSDDRGLIRYLMRNKHSTPFEMVDLKFMVKVPMYIWRQWIRHRTASVNEVSGRYSIVTDSTEHTNPQEWRSQSTTNKQGSAEHLEDWPEKWKTEEEGVYYAPQYLVETNRCNINTLGEYLSEQEEILLKKARDVYKERIEAGVAREQARKDLPLSTYTEAYWKINLHNLFHFLSLRMDSHAQYEIRQYANIIGNEIVKPLLPHCWEAFEDYRLNGMFLTGPEIETLNNILDNGGPGYTNKIIENSTLSKREQTDFQNKLERLNYGT